MPTPIISNHFRYKITDQIGQSIVVPLGESDFTIEWNFESDTGKRFYSKNFGGKIIFTGAAFQRLLQFEVSIYRCVFQTVIIEQKCVGSDLKENWIQKFTGRISLNAGEWNLDACEVTLKFEPSSPDQCFKDHKGDKINLLQFIPQRYTVALYSASTSLEKVVYTDNKSDDGNCGVYVWQGAQPPNEGKWSVYKHDTTITGSFCNNQTRWVRQVLTVPCAQTPPSGDWTLIEDTCSTGGSKKYARYASLYDCQYMQSDGGDIEQHYTCQIVGDTVQNISIDNGVKLYDVINLFVTTYCPGLTLKSDFFLFNVPIVPGTVFYDTAVSGTHDLNVNGSPSSSLLQVRDFPVDVGIVTNMFFIWNGTTYYILSAEYVPNGLEGYYNLILDQNITAGLREDQNFVIKNGPSRLNYVTGATSKVDNILVFQKSDVKRRAGTGNATVAEWTFEKLMTHLKFMFNVDWRIDGTDFRIEHVSYWNKNAGLDLTIPKYAREMKGKRSYTYKTEKIPRSEIWKFKEAAAATDFAGVPIKYTDCVTSGSGDTDATYAMDDVTTDVQLIIENPEHDSAIVSDDGFVFIATVYDGGIYYVITENGILNDGRLNNTLAVAQLQRDYHMYERPLKHGNMNKVETEFYSTLPLKKGDTITIPLCCDTEFNPDDTITTFLGTGTVDKAAFNFNTQTVALDLVYEANVGLTPNTAPKANNDVFTIYVDTIGTFDVATNDTDVDTDDYVMKVEIVGNPSHGNAYIEDGKIKYIPFGGYTGSDVMTYRIYDKWGAVSNLALINVTVRPVNTPPVANPDTYTVYTQNMPVTIPAPGPLGNDTDDNTFTLQSAQTTSAQGGTVNMLSTGAFTYNRPSGFTGMDSFTYVIVDDVGLTATGTVNLNVISNQVPVANPDSYTTPKNTSLPVSSSRVLTSNDTTPTGGPYTYTATVETKATTAGGSVSIQANGQFAYTPPSNFAGDDTFTYTVSNGVGTAVGSVTIHVLPTIYVKLIRSATQSQPVYASCGGGGQTLIGNQTSSDFNIYFYSDAGGTAPLNTTGMGLIVKIKNDITDTSSGSSSFIENVGPVSGTVYAYGRHITRSSLSDCSGKSPDVYTATYSLSAGNYITL